MLGQRLSRTSVFWTVWKVKFHVQTILMSVRSNKPLLGVLWKHNLCLFFSHFFFMLLIMCSMKTAMLKEFCLQMSSVISLYCWLWSKSLKLKFIATTDYLLIFSLIVGVGNTKGGSITVPLTSCLTGLKSAVWPLTIFVFICKTD